MSAMPLLPILVGAPVDQVWKIVAVECVTWIALWAAFKRPAWFHWLLLPAFLAVPIEIYLRIYFGQGISTHHLGIILETSPKEALEFLGSKVWGLALVVIAVVAWWIGGWVLAIRSHALGWNGVSRWVTIGLLVIGMLIWSYGYEFGVVPNAEAANASASTSVSDTAEEVEDAEDGISASQSSAADSTALPDAGSAASNQSAWPQLPAWAGVLYDRETLGKTWPFGLTIRAYEFWKEREYLSELASKSRLFTFGAHQSELANTPQIVVMVIGESSRYDRWSLNGYKRETNPLLKKEANLVSLSNVVTAVSATRLAVPVLVSRKPAMQSLKAGFSEKSFLTAFKEAGFKTFWLSNQMSFGQFDTPVSVFANEADVTQFLNLGGFTNHSSYDEILLDPLKIAIADPALKKLIVLHTLGNHWNYSHRHPKQYDQWRPSLFGIENPAYTDLKIKEQLNNSYDNSILYTDWFLSQLISVLRSTGQLSSMMYVSDHGQTLYDGTCGYAFHGHNTDYEFHVPALVWYSDLYQQVFPGKVAQLKRNQRAKLATENAFHSLVDMADIRYSSEKLEWSFLSRKFKRHKRYVDSYGWTDYDNAVLKGDCKEVIDKGKPLVQEK